MRSLSFFLLNFLFILISNAQTSVKSGDKPPLDFSILGKWPYVEYPKISNDGKHAFYTYKENDKETLVIKATEGSWEKRIEGVGSFNAVITENSRFVVVKKNDSLLITTVSKNHTEAIANVASYKTPQEGSGDWLAYRLNNEAKELVIRSLNNGKEKRFPSVGEYIFSKEGNALLLKVESGKDKYSLQLVYPRDGKSVTIWQGTRADNICFDNAGGQLAFIAEAPDHASTNVLWYYRHGMGKAVVFSDNKTAGIEEGLSISNSQVRFNKDGSKVFFYLEPPPLPKPKPGYVSVDVWSYLDERLQSDQLNHLGSTEKYLSVINIEPDQQNLKVIRLEQEGDEVNADIENIKGNYLLVSNRKGNGSESHWNPASFTSVYLVSAKGGSRKVINERNPVPVNTFMISFDEKFIIGFDAKQSCFSSYEIATGVTRNISKNISFSLCPSSEESNFFSGFPFGMPFLLQNDEAVLIYDQYDIWQIDPLGVQKPINLTNGYGRRNQIVFRFLQNEGLINNSLNKNNKLLVAAFNKKNKNNGFYNVTIGKQKDPELLSMGQNLYFFHDPIGGFKPLKSKYDNSYLVCKMGSTEPPNYFFTKNFKNYTPLSNILSPHATYNWFTTHLIEWETFDGRKSQGILYKPDNFDSTKKYPIIFLYYEEKSDFINKFLTPEFSTGELNIPYFVSNGYLVFTPDIHYKIGYPGESAYNAVVSAAKFLSQLKWVDSTKMGINGHSFGGYETNYLVTHTNIFAAAVSSSGFCDLMSWYGTIVRPGYSIQWAEKGQGRFRATPWEKPDIYISNSPIYKADKVETPLLMMNNKNDKNVPFTQGVEFFTALRRLGKKVWMLQYDGGSHIAHGSEKTDYTRRMKQFFDHYLKGTQPGKWMTRGIPANIKGIDDGFRIDTEIDAPNHNVLNEK